jgi:DNA helicase IV
LKSEPNIIISGCAGSGKTLLACYLAKKYAINYKTAILTYTKSLRTFISDFLSKMGIENVSVLYKAQWDKKIFQEHDIIIVDEFQDFSINDIQTVIRCAKIGVYFFGDSEQRIYLTNTDDESTVELNKIIEYTGFKHFNLKDNFRISVENMEFIHTLYKSNSLDNSFFNSGYKPKILQFENTIDELNWLKDFLVCNNEFKNIGILLKQNDGFKGAYFYKRKLKVDQIYGIIELYNFLKKHNISVNYKYKNDDNLIFTKEMNINIMTFHSSKGLQFDCVILPFSNYINENNKTINLPYVGLTRATKQIILTYSGLAADEYSVPITPDIFDGTLIIKSNRDEPIKIDDIEPLVADCKVIKL